MGNLVRLARRRILGNQLFAQGANAVIAALAVFILLLLFGTQILSWQVALSVPLAAAAFGIAAIGPKSRVNGAYCLLNPCACRQQSCLRFSPNIA